MKTIGSIILAAMALFHGEHIFGQRDSVAMKYAATITADQMKQHLYILAGDEYKGRDTGSEEMKMAAEYLINQYKAMGVGPCIDGSEYIQHYPLKRVKFGESTITSGGNVYAFKKDFYSFGGFDASSLPETKIVFAGYGVTQDGYDDYSNVSVKDAVAMCIMGEPTDKEGNSIFTGNTTMSEWSDDFRLKRDLAMKNGAKAILFIEPNFDYIIQRIGYFLDQPRMSLDYPNVKEEESTIPYFFISPAMANAILKKGKMKTFEQIAAKIAQKKAPKSKALKTSCSAEVRMEKEKIEGENVLCFIEGSDKNLKNEVVVVSAHFDHVGVMGGKIYNGADDDGSGTVTALEIAEAFQLAKKDGHGPRRSVLVLHVSGEEKGLLGSEWYSEYPIFPLENTVCDLNIDMIGRVDDAHLDNSKYVYVIGSDKLSTELHDISEKTNAKYTSLELDYTYNDPSDPNRFYYRSDHYNFAKHNIPVIFYFSGVHEDYHQPGDDPEKIMYDKMSVIGQLIFHTAWEVANRDKKLVVDVESDFED